MIKVSRGCLGDEELAAVREAFEYGYFGLAFKVTEFEEALKNYLGAEHVIATNSGTSALHLALDSLGIGDGDEVIVPSLTFVASFQAIRATGAAPVPCDVQPDTLLADLNDVEKRITPKTKALMPVHYAGNTCDLDGLFQLKERYGLRIVEDAAHAFGSTYKGRKIGSSGDVVCFSFDSLKNITCGEGGAVVCRDKALAERMRQKRVLGIIRKPHPAGAPNQPDWEFEVTTHGFRYHMSNINAAIGLAQLKKVESFIARRREICRLYDQAFKDIPSVQPLRINYDEAAPHIYVIRVKDGKRNALMQFLRDAGIETGINYIPNHLHPYFRREGLPLPETEHVYREILTLPLHCALSGNDVEQIIGRVVDFFKSRGAYV
jgi:dTDP-4-amino-4,6-dideoxygalactose transaminase